jgi:hypothetical protein
MILFLALCIPVLPTIPISPEFPYTVCGCILKQASFDLSAPCIQGPLEIVPASIVYLLVTRPLESKCLPSLYLYTFSILGSCIAMGSDFRNLTVTEEPQWNSTPAWKLPGCAEPLVRIDSDWTGIKLMCLIADCCNNSLRDHDRDAEKGLSNL